MNFIRTTRLKLVRKWEQIQKILRGSSKAKKFTTKVTFAVFLLTYTIKRNAYVLNR